jgi:hypothetical protein
MPSTYPSSHQPSRALRLGAPSYTTCARRLVGGLGVFSQTSTPAVTLCVEPLKEVALSMEERHTHERQSEVSSTPERVAGQDAQAPAVGEDLALESDLHREVRDQRVLRHRAG